MATPEEILAELNAGTPSPGRGSSAADLLAELNAPTGFQPVIPPTRSREQQQRLTRLGIIREKAAKGEPVDFDVLPQTTEQLAQGLTLDGSDVQREVFASMPTLGRTAIVGAARLGALMENPILRLQGRGDLADQNTRKVNAFSEYSRRLASEGPLGETVGGILHDVGESLTLGTLAAPFGGGGIGGAAATRQLAATSAAFGLDGADRVWNETEHLSRGQRMAAYARQFAIDGLLTFAGGKLVQNLGLNPGRYFGASVGKAAQQVAERSGLNQIVGSALADGGVEGTQGALSYLNRVYTGLEDFTWDGLASNFFTSAAVGGLAGAATSGVQTGIETAGQAVEFKRAVEQFQKEFPKAVEGIRAANEFVSKATPEQIQAAVDATTAKDFDAATGQKGKGPVHREAFEVELESLVALQTELEQRGVTVQKSLDSEQALIESRRNALAEAETEFAELNTELREIEAEFRDKPHVRPSRRRTAVPRQQGDPGPFPLESVSASHALPGSDVDITPAQRQAFTEESIRSFGDARREVVQLRKELNSRKEAIEIERDALVKAVDALDVRRRTTEGEAAEYRAYLESEFDRIVAAEKEADVTPGSQKAERDGIDQLAGIDPPARPMTPKTFGQRYEELFAASQAIGKVSADTYSKVMPDDAARKDLGKLIDTYVEGQSNRVALFNSLANANTPGRMRKAMESIGKHLHNAETRVARQDYADALKKARHLRTEFARQIGDIKKNVNPKNVDSLRDAAESLRDLTYQSATADTLLNSERDASITATADTAASEIGQARALAMKSDDPLRKAFGRVTPEDRITRGSADSTWLREGASRPEVQLARISPTLHKLMWNDLGVEAQAKLNNYTLETQQGFDSVIESLGIGRDDSLSATVANLATGGRGTKFNQWRREEGTVEGVPMKRGDAWFLTLLDMDPRNAKVLESGGWVFPDGRTIPKFNERVRNQLYDFVGPEGLKLAEWAFRYTNGPVIDRVNDAFLRARGRVLTEHKDVVPRMTDTTWDAVGESPFATLTDPKLTGYGHLRRREETEGPLTWPEGTQDGFDYMMRHWDRMNRIAAFLVPARDAQAVLNKPNVKNAILAKDGKEGLENIQEAIRVQVNGPKRAAGGKGLRRRNAVAAAATIGWRLPTWMIQGTGAVLSAAWNPRGVRNFVKAMPALWSREMQAEMRQVLGQNSSYYRQKFLQNEYATEQSGGIYQVADRFDPPSIAQHAMRPQRQIDHDVVAPLHYGQAKATVADQGILPGTPEYGPAVAREWERSMYRGETASHGMELPGFLRSGVENAAVGIWGTFQSQGARLYSLLPRAMDLADKGQYKDAIAVASVAMASALATGTIRAFMSMREREEGETTPENVAKNVALEFAGSPPILGLFLQPLARSAMGMRTYGDAPLVVEDAMDFAKAVGDVASQIMDQGDAATDKKGFFEKLMAVTEPLAKFGGLPVGGLDDFRKRLASGAGAEDVWSGLGKFFPGLQQQDKQMSWQDAVDMLNSSERTE